ncbi:MAG: GntR family transcriptional regulator [Sedimentisphaerales bacterium]|nr:GntR family transcriptional regulator [Sedimentisphaerales bacterium]
MAANKEIPHTMTAVPMHQIFDCIPFHEQIKKNNALADEVYEYILREIVFPGEDHETGIHYAGKITESMVAKELQISNGPVREAFYRLRQENWLYTDRNRGSYLVDFSDMEIALEIYRFRVNCETGSFYCLASRITEDQLLVLHSIIKRMDRAIHDSDIRLFRQEDIHFHLTVNEMAGGSQFIRVYRPRLMQWYAMSYQVLLNAMGTEQYSRILEAPGIPTHRDLFDALARRSSPDSAELVSKHFSFIFQLLQSCPGKNQDENLPK